MRAFHGMHDYCVGKAMHVWPERGSVAPYESALALNVERRKEEAYLAGQRT